MRDTKKEVEGFLKLVADDAKLQEIVKKVDAAISKSKEEGEKVAKEELIPAAQERGFSFNEKEFLDYVSTAEKSLSSFSSQGEEETGKKSKFGGGKIGKLALLIGGGATVGIGGVAAIRHFNQPKKADVAQVQTLEQKDQENENKGEGEVQNDGLRSDEVKDQAPGENSEKTSDKLKEELEKHNENKSDTPTAPPAATGKTDEGNKPATPPSLSKEQKIELVDKMLDKIIKNEDGALDKGIEEAKRMGQEVNREEVIRAYRELKEKGTEEQKLQMYNMIVGQMLG